MSKFTKRASGNDEMSTWMKEVEAALDAANPIDCPGLITFDRTDNGWKANIKVARGGGGSSSVAGFRGEWLSSALYSSGETVVISLGANRGRYLYVAFTPSTGHEPWLGGGYWFKMSDSLGQWM